MQGFTRSGWWPPAGPIDLRRRNHADRPRQHGQSSMARRNRRERRFADERRPGGALASPQVHAKWSTKCSPQVRPGLGTRGYRDRRDRAVQPRPAVRHRGCRAQPAHAQPEGSGSPGQGAFQRDQQPERAVQRAADPAHPGTDRGEGCRGHLRAGPHRTQGREPRRRPARGPELHERRIDHPAAAADHEHGVDPDRPGGVRAGAAEGKRRPGEPDRRGRRRGAAGPRERRAADQAGEAAHRADGQQAAAGRRQDQHLEQLGVQEGHGRVQPDRQLPEHRHPDRQHDRRAGAALGTDPPR